MKCIKFVVFIILFLFLSSILFARVGGGDILFKVKNMGDVTFSHDLHVASFGMKCTNCHDATFTTKEKHKHVTMADMENGKSCGTCHDGKKAFDVKSNCNKCHK